MFIRRPIADWLNRQVEFSPSRPIAGRFSLRHSPFGAEPLAAIQTERNKTLMMMCSWQSFKTLWMELGALWLMANDAQASMWNSPNNNKAKEFSDTRFSELLDDCAPVRAMFAGDRFSNTKKLKRFVNSWLLIQGVEEIGNLQSKPVGYLFNDEGWLWPAGHQAEAKARTTKFKRWLQLHATTAGEIYTGVKTRIDENGEGQQMGPDETTQLWESSDKREWQLCCPDCRGQAHGGLFIPKWDQLVFDAAGQSKNDSGEWVLPLVRKNLRLICPLCQSPHANSERMRTTLNDGARYTATKPENTGGPVIAWHYNAIVHVDWVTLAEETIAAMKALRLGDSKPMKRVVQRRKAETWIAADYIHATSALKAGGYALGADWLEWLGFAEAIRGFFMTVDVQKDCFFAIIRKWGNGVSRQIAIEKVQTIDEVEALRLKWGLERNWVALDCGWNQQQVLKSCARFGYIALNGVKAKSFPHAQQEGPPIYRIYAPVRYQRPFLGTADDLGQHAPEVLFSTHAANDRLETLRATITDDDAKPDASPAIWTIADDAPELFKKHMAAVRKVEQRTKQNRPYFEWHQIGSRPDHWRDCELMQVIMASMANLIGAEAVAGDGDDKKPTE